MARTWLSISVELVAGRGEDYQFAYTFDFGDDWQHLCTVDPARVDPEQLYGVPPAGPVAYWGWGAMPDQYGRRFADDDGDGPIPPDPEGRDLPAFFAPWRWRAEGSYTAPPPSLLFLRGRDEQRLPGGEPGHCFR